VYEILSDIGDALMNLVIRLFAFFQLFENFFLRASRRCKFASFLACCSSGAHWPTLRRWTS